MSSTSRAAKILAPLLGASLVVGALVIGMGLMGTRDVPSGTATAEGQSGESQHPLDVIPGFGKGEDARMRDDAIGLWEAFRRESRMVECMKDLGYDYHVDLRAAGSDVEGAASFVGRVSDPARVPRGDQQNDAVKSKLDKDELNGYYLALYGVSWDDVSNEKGNITQSGCFAEALKTVPSVFAPRERLSDELLELNRSLANMPEMLAAGDAYAACAKELGVDARDQGELEASGSPPKVVDAVIEACGPRYDDVRARELAAEEAKFLTAHPELLKHVEHYQGVKDRMQSDIAFLDALGA